MTASAPNPRDDAPEGPNQDAPSQPPPTSDPKAQRIAEKSPEGVPGSPETDRSSVGLIITVIVIVALIAAVLVAVFVNRWFGLGVAVFAVGLLFFNPVFWAATQRAKERG